VAAARAKARLGQAFSAAQHAEGHLSQLFHKTLHELEALQTKRSGGVAPLARLDVDGLAVS
jgi:hypothetical protein